MLFLFFFAIMSTCLVTFFFMEDINPLRSKPLPMLEQIDLTQTVPRRATFRPFAREDLRQRPSYRRTQAF